MRAALAVLAYLIGVFFSATSFAASPAPDKVGRAISGTLQTAMTARGFAANDPRYINTLSRAAPVLSGAAGSAAAITLSGITAPAWASVAVAGGIGFAIGVAVGVGVYALAQWHFRTDGKIDQSTTGANLSYDSASFNVGDSVWLWTRSDGVKIYAGDGIPLATEKHYYERRKAGLTERAPNECVVVSATQVRCENSFVSKVDNSPYSCPRGTMAMGSVCTAFTYPIPAPVPAKQGQTVQQAINELPASDLQKQLNPAILAALANRAWEQAALAPGYDGLPYSPTNPVRAQDAAQWMDSNPTHSPTVQDFVAPNPQTAQNQQPWALPSNPTTTDPLTSPTPNQGTTNPAAESPQVNLGPDPGIGSPTLEQLPTGQQVVAPIADLLSDFTSFDANLASGNCPTPTLNIFGQSILVDGHCSLVEQNRSIIASFMALVWVLVAARIILSA